MIKITSKDNALIKHIMKLKEKKYRNEYDEYLIEGIKLVKEAIDENINIKNIIISEEAVNSELFEKKLKEKLQNREYTIVQNSIFKLISDVEKPQGAIAIIKKREKDGKIDFSNDVILALDDIQDPGNLGTIIRTADSCNVTQILLSKGTVDCYNSKVIRSTMGAIFRVKIIECENLEKTLKEIKENNFKIIVTDLNSKKNIYNINYEKSVIVIGNEANGISKNIIDLADEKVIIPMIGKTESLNASVATGVILYEYARQKMNY